MKAIVFPGKYYQGPGAIGLVADYAEKLGATKPMIVWGRKAKYATVDKVTAGFEAKGMPFEEHLFITDCTHATSEAIIAEVKEKGCDLVIGIGGGKALDMAKSVAIACGLKMISAPTIASNDAPTSACTVWYDDDHVCVGFDMWPYNPDIVLADTEVMAAAPIHMFKAGIGDALATNIEAMASCRADNPTCAWGTPTETVKAMAQLCFDLIMDNAEDAIISAEAGVTTAAFEKVVEANVLLSGVGWESGGLCTAHVLGNGLPEFPETHEYMHGDKVSFGIVTELMLDPNITTDEKYDIVSFLVRVGLPVCFEDLNMQDVSKERIMAWCDVHTQGSFTANHAFVVTKEDLYNAMIAADAYGRRMKEELA
ncbi:MAG: glycerol dehydrogenase [Lachnospiraceae bacterium]|nr:glycerol dehydrogenase [Lachnospiraceae bacterium]